MRPGLAVFTRGMLHSTKYKYKRKGGSGHHYKSLRSKNMSYMGFHVTGEKKANQWKGMSDKRNAIAKTLIIGVQL